MAAPRNLDNDARLARVRALRDQLVELVGTRLGVEPAAHNLRRIRREASEAAAVANALADAALAVDESQLRGPANRRR
jgi:hypothetical protein